VPRRSVTAIAVAAMLLLIVTAAFARQLGWLGPAEDASPTFAVGLIREDDVPDSLRQGRVLTDMVATNLARVDGLRVLANSRLLEVMRPGADPAAGYSDAARRAGATELLEGQLLRASGILTLELRRVELRTGIVRDVYRVSASNRYALADSVTQLISTRMRLLSPSGSIADATTKSLVAYRFYEEGLRAYHLGDLTTAQRMMRAAVMEDSSFAMAAWYEAFLGVPEPIPAGWHISKARQRALRLAERAPERERLLISANVLADNNDPRAVQVAESLTTRYPDDPRALVMLARMRTGAGEWPGAVAALERAIILDSIAEVDETSICRVCDDFYRLAEVYGSWDSLAAVQRTARRFLAMRPKQGSSHTFLAWAAARLGDSASAYDSYRRLAADGHGTPHFKLGLDLSLEQYDLVERDVRRLLGSASMFDWGNSAFVYFITLRAQGRVREAAAFSRNGWIPGLPPLLVDRQPAAFFEAIAALEAGDARGAVRWFLRMPVTQDSGEWAPGVVARNRAWRGTLTGMALAAAGDTATLRAIADSVERWGRASAYGRDRKAHHYLHGMLDVAAGRDEDAVRRFRDAIYSPSLGFTRVNFELGRALLRLNRPQEAIAALQPALRGVFDASNLYISRTELHYQLAEAFDRAGMTDSAAVHYRAVIRAWHRADAQFHDRRGRAAGWLARNERRAIAGS
jgi:tetratricopeptide (TPR) repeat protein